MNPEDRLRELRDEARWAQVRVPHAEQGPATHRTARAVRVGQLVAAFAIAIVLVTGLLLGLTALRGASPAPASPKQTPATRTSAQATFTVVPGARHAYSASTGPNACTSAQLQTESEQDGGGAAGTYIQAIWVLNTGSDCLVEASAVRVDGVVASLSSTAAPHGLVLPAHAVGRIWVTTAESCDGGSTAAIDPSKPTLPITLEVGGRSRTMMARFPQSRCAAARAEAGLVDPASSPLQRSNLLATTSGPFTTTAGSLRYDVSIRTAGTKALVLSTCPSATEVLSDGLGAVLTRTLTLQCPSGTTLEPDVPVTVPITTSVPTSGTWTVAWYLGAASGTTTASTTCALSRLTISEPGPGGASTGNWVQLVTVRDRGPACTLPVSAFALDGHAAHAGRASDERGFALGSGVTTRFAASTNIGCGDGAANTSTLGPNAKPLVVQLGGHTADGLKQLLPIVACAGLIVERIS